MIISGVCASLLFVYAVFSNVSYNVNSDHVFNSGSAIKQFQINPPTKSYHKDPFPGYDRLAYEDLHDNPVPNTIHYVWCHKETLSFEHYLSIVSAWKFMRPDAIEFHTVHNFNFTEKTYDMWLTELKKTIAGFSIHKIPENWDGEENGCGVWLSLIHI